MTLGWRPATPADDAAVVGLCLALFDEDPSPHRPGEDAIRRTLTVFRAEPVRGRALVLADGDEVAVGYALLAACWSNELGGELCVIDELYVAPGARGAGHGSALLRALAAGDPTLWPRDAVALDLETTAGNARARAL